MHIAAKKDSFKVIIALKNTFLPGIQSAHLKIAKTNTAAAILEDSLPAYRAKAAESKTFLCFFGIFWLSQLLHTLPLPFCLLHSGPHTAPSAIL